MRTTSLTALLVVGACAPIGQPGHHGGNDDGPDAGVAQASCDSMTTKTMNVTYTGAAVDGLPSSCWKLAGKLTISGSVTSLDKLGDLREVDALEISGPITAIDKQLKVDKQVYIHDTTALVDLGKLEVSADPTCLTYLDSVSIVANSALTDLKGLSGLMCVSGPTVIQNNINLPAIHLDSAHRLEGGVLIQDNTKLTTLSFNNVQSMSHDLVIRHNVALTTISAMSSLQYMHGGITIDDNDALTSLATMFPTGFPNIEGVLSITGNAKLTDLGQLAHVPQVFSTIRIDTNDQLQYCSARAVGCCVAHYGTAAVDGIGTGSCHSWCYDAQGCYATN